MGKSEIFDVSNIDLENYVESIVDYEDSSPQKPIYNLASQYYSEVYEDEYEKDENEVEYYNLEGYEEYYDDDIEEDKLELWDSFMYNPHLEPSQSSTPSPKLEGVHLIFPVLIWETCQFPNPHHQ